MNTTPQHLLPPKQKNNLKWGSHIPLDKTILKTFPDVGVLELGAGLYSTKLFFEQTKHAVSIEANHEWIQNVLDDGLQTDENHKIIYHELPKEITHHLLPEQVSKSILADSIDFYKANMNDNLNFLFVDCYVGFRLNALQELHELFDVIVYHDAEPRVDKFYKYSQFNPSTNYDYYIDSTFLVHNGLLIKKSLAPYMEDFMKNFEIECNNFSKQFNTSYNVNITKKV